MYWKDAMQLLRSNDFQQGRGVITHRHYKHQLQLPPLGPSCIRLLPSEEAFETGERSVESITLPEREDVDPLVKKMLQKVGLPLTGWIPGSGGFGSYKLETIQSQLLTLIRLELQKRMITQIKVEDVHCTAGESDEPLFRTALLNLIQDAQGLIADEETGTLRLATWREAMKACQDLVAQTKERHDGNLVPQIQLFLNKTYPVCWIALNQTNEYHVHLQVEPYAHLEGGDEEAVDLFLAEQKVSPIGWAATYGIEPERLEPRNPEKEERLQQEWLAEVAQWVKGMRYTLESSTLLRISFTEEDDGEQLSWIKRLLTIGQKDVFCLPTQQRRGELPSLHVAFSSEKDLEWARELLKLPAALQVQTRTEAEALLLSQKEVHAPKRKTLFGLPFFSLTRE